MATGFEPWGSVLHAEPLQLGKTRELQDQLPRASGLAEIASPCSETMQSGKQTSLVPWSLQLSLSEQFLSAGRRGMGNHYSFRE